MMRIRELDRDTDRAAIEALDTGFETDVIFELVAGARSIELVERKLERPITKRYDINVPGIRAYERLGYSLRGVDVHYYGDYMPGESAIYLAKNV